MFVNANCQINIVLSCASECAKAYFVFAVSKDATSSLQDVQRGAEVDGKA